MARSETGLARAMIAAIAERRYDDGVELLDPDAEWHNTSVFPGPERIVGATEIGRFWRDLFESYRGSTTDSTLLVDAARASLGVVVISVHGRGAGTESGVPIDQRWAHVLRFRDGRITRVETYGSYDAALDAAALSP